MHRLSGIKTPSKHAQDENATSDKLKESLILLLNSRELAMATLFSPQLSFLARQMNTSAPTERHVLPSIIIVSSKTINPREEWCSPSPQDIPDLNNSHSHEEQPDHEKQDNHDRPNSPPYIVGPPNTVFSLRRRAAVLDLSLFIFFEADGGSRRERKRHGTRERRTSPLKLSEAHEFGGRHGMVAAVDGCWCRLIVPVVLIIAVFVLVVIYHVIVGFVLDEGARLSEGA